MPTFRLPPRPGCLGAFHDTINQNHVDFDVYAVSFSGIGWYVKISIEPVLNVDQTVSEQVFSISCHPLGKALMTNDGEVQP